MYYQHSTPFSIKFVFTCTTSKCTSPVAFNTRQAHRWGYESEKLCENYINFQLTHDALSLCKTFQSLSALTNVVLCPGLSIKLKCTCTLSQNLGIDKTRCGSWEETLRYTRDTLVTAQHKGRQAEALHYTVLPLLLACRRLNDTFNERKQ